MARHRHINKKFFEEDYDDDDDYDDYGSPEDEVAMSPSVLNQYLINRNPEAQPTNTSAVRDYETEPRPSGDGLVFSIDDVADDFQTQTNISSASKKDQKKQNQKASATPKAANKPLNPNVSNLKISENARSHSKSPSRKKIDQQSSSRCSTPTQSSGLTSNSSTHRLNQLAQISQQSTPRRERKKLDHGKELINLVVVGHVDAGKSTLMGHFLVQLGCVDQRLVHKYKQDATRVGKSSFAFAWVLDETEEERTRGVTMDIARTSFETDSKRVVLLDAPGHKDFIPNMITGASQADAAILVVNATVGEFETGFANGGQTKEHAMLLRSLGVSQLIVAINKLDMVNWSQARFDEVKALLNEFLTKMAGFRKVIYVPLSGLLGENLVNPFEPGHPALEWYEHGPLVQYIDAIEPPKRAADGGLRIIVHDVMKSSSNTLSISGKIESGEIEIGDKVYIMPNADAAIVKACSNDNGLSDGFSTVGDQVLMTLTGTFEPDTHHAGDVIVRGGEDTLIPTRHFTVRLVVFDVAVPIMKGTKAELYCHSVCEPCTIVKLISSINKTTGEVLRAKPRCLSKHMSGLVEIETEHDIAMEPYTVCKALGRITLRTKGETIAAGIIEKANTIV